MITTVAVLSPSPNVDLWLRIWHYRQSVNFQNDPFSCTLKEELNEGVRGMGGWVGWSGGEITTLFCVPELYYPQHKQTQIKGLTSPLDQPIQTNP